MGGAVAQRLALRYPELVSSMVLLSTRGGHAMILESPTEVVPPLLHFLRDQIRNLSVQAERALQTSDRPSAATHR